MLAQLTTGVAEYHKTHYGKPNRLLLSSSFALVLNDWLKKQNKFTVHTGCLFDGDIMIEVVSDNDIDTNYKFMKVIH